MSKLTRQKLKQFLDAIDWKEIPNAPTPTDPEVPYATHEGILRIGEFELLVYQLNTGQRIIDEKSLRGFFVDL